jgi:hypothetical protein
MRLGKPLAMKVRPTLAIFVVVAAVSGGSIEYLKTL